MLEYDPAVNLRHWPMQDMSRYGTNPYGENLYRIVFRESRRKLVGGEWPDGSRCYHWTLAYPEISSPWILEGWDLPRMSKRAWDNMLDPLSGWPVLGPYPARGEFYFIWEFDMGGPEQDSLDKIINASRNGAQRSFQEVRDYMAKEYAAEDKAEADNRFGMIRESMTAFGGAPISYGRHGRGTKTAPELMTAKQAGMPVPNLPRGKGPLGMSSTISSGMRI